VVRCRERAEAAIGEPGVEKAVAGFAGALLDSRFGAFGPFDGEDRMGDAEVGADCGDRFGFGAAGVAKRVVDGCGFDEAGARSVTRECATTWSAIR
jgi:hypothetical protein